MGKRDDIGQWILMHKNIVVAELEIMEKAGVVTQVTKTFDTDHAPLGTLNRLQKTINPESLDAWLRGRAIPASRQNIDKFLRGLNILNTSALSLKSYGLSLSDQYWVKPRDADLSWEAINFFQNDFSDDIGEILFQNKDVNHPDIKVISPDANTDGILRKKWTIQDGKRVLMKGDSDLAEQRPFNEEIASKIMTRLSINHIPYTVIYTKSRYYCLCDNFINEDTELITAAEVIASIATEVTSKNDSKYVQLLKCCDHLGIGGIKCRLEEMMVVDYLIANSDRHWGNFGFIRDADTLEWKDFAPIFDSGNSLWFDKRNITDQVLSETFESTHDEQIKLVTDLSWYEVISTAELTEMIKDTFDKHLFMDEARKAMIIDGVVRNSEVIADLKRSLM